SGGIHTCAAVLVDHVVPGAAVNAAVHAAKERGSKGGVKNKGVCLCPLRPIGYDRCRRIRLNIGNGRQVALGLVETPIPLGRFVSPYRPIDVVTVVLIGRALPHVTAVGKVVELADVVGDVPGLVVFEIVHLVDGSVLDRTRRSTPL